MKTIGERIKQARAERGWSAYELAKKSGYKTQSGIGNLENKATGSGGNKIGEIAKALSVSVDWLLNGPDSDNVPFLPPVLQQGQALPPWKLAGEQESSALYAVTNNFDWPFELFSQADWLLLSPKEREEIENSIAGAVLRAKKTNGSSKAAPHST